MSFTPITTVKQLDSLNEETLVRGYLAGYNNTPNYTETDQAYWHGYLNGQCDGKHMPISEEQRALARAFVDRMRAIH